MRGHKVRMRSPRSVYGWLRAEIAETRQKSPRARGPKTLLNMP